MILGKAMMEVVGACIQPAFVFKDGAAVRGNKVSQSVILLYFWHS